jgi:hypothetical protein
MASKAIAWSCSNMKILIVSAFLGAAAIPMVWQHQQLAATQKQNQQLRAGMDEFARKQNGQASENELLLAEINRLKKENQELYRLRGEISALREEASQRISLPAAKVTQPDENLAETSEQAQLQVTVEAKFITMPTPAMQSIDLFAEFQRSPGKEFKKSLTASDLQALLEKLTKTEGVEMLAAPKVTTLNRRPARVSIAETMKFAGQALDFGPELEVVPFVSPDHAIELTLSASFGEFLGYAQTEKERIPRFRVRQASDTRAVSKGGAVLLGLSKIIASADDSQTNGVFVLITPWLIDERGNQIQ